MRLAAGSLEFACEYRRHGGTATDREARATMAPAKKAAKKSAKKATAKKATKRSPAKKATKKATAKKATKKSTRKKATKRSSASRSSSKQENVVVASKLREAIRSQDIRMSGDLPDALNAEIHALIDRAVARAKGNGRGTVRPTDL
jgi:hypothetical protein